MSIASSNWIHSGTPILSLQDKIKELLKLGQHKLVLVQYHELERLKTMKHKDNHVKYINYLYNHYIVEGLPKTYINP